jgi:hypothetical protein
MKALLLLVPALALAPAASSQYPSIAHGPGLPVQYFDYRDFVWQAGRGGYAIAFHLDVAVQNLAYEKHVGVVWTADQWVSTLTCDLAYEGPLDAGYEKWGADCKYPTVATSGGVDFAVYATMGGTTYWDNDGGKNHRLGEGIRGLLPSPERGVSVFDEGIWPSSPTSPTPHAIGYAQVWPYSGGEPGARTVTVVYTTDHWATTQTYAAGRNTDGTYSWDIPVPATAPTLEFAVSYDVAGMTFWDNRNGANYVDAIWAR